MKRTLTLLIFTLTLQGAVGQDCLEQWKKAFEERGAYSVADDIHRKVYIAFIEEGVANCVLGKARVENGKVVSIFLQYEDGTYELMDVKFTNKAKLQPGITNGISEEIITEDREHLYIIFVEKLKPKQKEYKVVGGPDDL
jgi:hypothetical protein